jgi:hypothetical protein
LQQVQETDRHASGGEWIHYLWHFIGSLQQVQEADRHASGGAPNL